MAEYETKREDEESCPYRVLDRNPKTGKLWHPPYCGRTFDMEPGEKIKCKYLGSVVTLNLTEKSEKYKKAMHVTVNLCELGSNNKKPKKDIINFLKGIFNIK